jgi:GNAT superfamily N-acetyltransferase
MAFPPVTYDVVRRLEDAVTAFSVRRLETLAALPGNPAGLELEWFGGALAPASPSQPELDFVNRVEGLEPKDADWVGEIVARYRRLGIRPWFELAPHPGFDRLASELSEAGAAQTGFFTALYGEPEPAGEPSANVVVHAVDPGEAAGAARLLLEGLGAPAEAFDSGAASLVATGARFYLAELDGQPAAAGALFVTGNVGCLASAATLPAFRGRGAQSALIRVRVDDAHAAGCDLVATVAAFGSTSQRNLERAGLRIAYTKAIWRLR